MKLWYRCKCCDKKNIVIETLEIGHAFGHPDTEHERLKAMWEPNWQYLDAFIQCLQGIIFKIDGGDNIYSSPDEFGDSVETWPPWFREKYTAPPRKSKKAREKEKKMFGCSFAFSLALDWKGYGGLVINDAWYNADKIGIVDFERDSKLNEYKRILTTGRKLEVRYKLASQIKITEDTDEHGTTKTLTVNDDFLICEQEDDHAGHDHSNHTHEPPPTYNFPPPNNQPYNQQGQAVHFLFKPLRVIKNRGGDSEYTLFADDIEEESEWEIQCDGFKWKNEDNDEAWANKIITSHDGVARYLKNYLESHRNEETWFELKGKMINKSGDKITINQIDDCQPKELSWDG